MFEIPFVTLVGIIIIVIYITSKRHKERMELIRKGINPNAFEQQMPQTNPGNKTLFIGLVGTSIGFACFISSIFGQRGINHEVFTIALLFMFGGGAMLLYWKITEKDRENARRMQEELLARTIENQFPCDEKKKNDITVEEKKVENTDEKDSNNDITWEGPK